MTTFTMATMDIEEISVTNDINYEETLSINVYTAKNGEAVSLKCYFGSLLRSEHSEHKVVKEFIKILDVFGKATDVFQGSKYPTLNLTMIFHVEIKDNTNITPSVY
ncbi:hypothetical protein Bhyg_12418 [Pseudolycoriella hygida]|uniref:Uncharacterized protein n=1 Tax=Pseudolycoriella hygida TaxID=35572 RepID=A0A9Q0MX65_9DIPT|nr:hypothetical protein Bhyg_12418 [Pseudolycoriella hygida]